MDTDFNCSFVFQYLDFVTVLKIAAVSKKWKERSESNKLWQHLIPCSGDDCDSIKKVYLETVRKLFEDRADWKTKFLNCDICLPFAAHILFYAKKTSFLRMRLEHMLTTNNKTLRDMFDEILTFYFKNFNFKDVHICEALRMTFRKLRLPSEAQRIDAILQRFAEQYSSQNQNAYDKDAIFVLTFSLVMLYTDHENRHIKQKMTKDHFLSGNRGIVAGGSFPDEFLSKAFDDIDENGLGYQTKYSERMENPTGLASSDVWFEERVLVQTGTISKTWDKYWMVIFSTGMCYLTFGFQEAEIQQSFSLLPPTTLQAFPKTMELHITKQEKGVFNFEFSKTSHMRMRCARAWKEVLDTLQKLGIQVEFKN
eukprot:Phypoly_transcript_11076.p1 GENE.Phypoly_transcript_11076~~Phypoly_transcript_11076.p1  ORF type:complete len:379 (+),score=55.84 Phypoly_transcript_11076:37-1137(+)